MNNRQVRLSLGINKSKSLALPSLELHYYDLFRKVNHRFTTGFHLSAWMQPEDQMFFADKAGYGMLAALQPRWTITKQLTLTADIGYKTPGWVFGNPYLDRRLTGRAGLSWHTRRR